MRGGEGAGRGTKKKPVGGTETGDKRMERETSRLRGINRGDVITEINAALSFRWQPKLPGRARFYLASHHPVSLPPLLFHHSSGK